MPDNDPTDDELEPDVDEPEQPADPTDDDDADPEGADQLGDAGTRALAAMKAKWKTERDKRRGLEQQLAARDTPPPADDADAIRAAADRTATARANQRVLRSEIRAAAAGRLQNPTDALRFIDLDQFEADDAGDFDQDEIREAIDDLLEQSPYLAVAQGQRRHGDGGNGPRGRVKPKQHTREDLDRMTAEQILAAQKAGELDHLLGKS